MRKAFWIFTMLLALGVSGCKSRASSTRLAKSRLGADRRVEVPSHPIPELPEPAPTQSTEPAPCPTPVPSPEPSPAATQGVMVGMDFEEFKWLGNLLGFSISDFSLPAADRATVERNLRTIEQSMAVDRTVEGISMTSTYAALLHADSICYTSIRAVPSSFDVLVSQGVLTREGAVGTKPVDAEFMVVYGNYLRRRLWGLSTPDPSFNEIVREFSAAMDRQGIGGILKPSALCTSLLVSMSAGNLY